MQIKTPRSIEDFYLEQNTRGPTDDDLYELLQVYSTPEFANSVLSELLGALIPQERLLLVENWGIIKSRVKSTLGGKSSKSKFVVLLVDFARGHPTSPPESPYITPRALSPINVIASPVDAEVETPEVKAQRSNHILGGFKRSITTLKKKEYTVSLNKNEVVVKDKNGDGDLEKSQRLTAAYLNTERVRKISDLPQTDYKFSSSDVLLTGEGMRGKKVYKTKHKRRIIVGRGAAVHEVQSNTHGNSKLVHRQLNKYLINADKLSNNIISARLSSSGNRIQKGYLAKDQHVSSEVGKLIEDICEDEFSIQRYNKLPKKDKEILYNFLDAAHVEINGIQNSNDKELEANVLFGEYNSGNKLPYIILGNGAHII